MSLVRRRAALQIRLARLMQLQAALHPTKPHRFSEWKPGSQNGRFFNTQWVRMWLTGRKGVAAEVTREGSRGDFKWAFWRPDQDREEMPHIQSFDQFTTKTLEEAKSRADRWLARVGVESKT